MVQTDALYSIVLTRSTRLNSRQDLRKLQSETSTSSRSRHISITVTHDNEYKVCYAVIGCHPGGIYKYQCSHLLLQLDDVPARKSRRFTDRRSQVRSVPTTNAVDMALADSPSQKNAMSDCDFEDILPSRLPALNDPAGFL
jgi:hypothetical protein